MSAHWWRSIDLLMASNGQRQMGKARRDLARAQRRDGGDEERDLGEVLMQQAMDRAVQARLGTRDDGRG